MVVTSDYIQIISTVIYASALGVSLVSFWQAKRSTRIQTEQQLYMKILSSSYSLWNNETISKVLAIALFGVLVISAVAPAPHASGGGGIISLVALGAQDVYLTNDDDALGPIVPGLDNDTNQH
jgi:hypothetical protein